MELQSRNTLKFTGNSALLLHSVFSLWCCDRIGIPVQSIKVKPDSLGAFGIKYLHILRNLELRTK